MKLIAGKDNVFILFYSVIYAISFCFVCINYITPVYGYANFVFVCNTEKVVLFLLLSMAMSVLVIMQRGCTRRFFIATLYIMSIIPFMCLYFCGSGYTDYSRFFLKGIVAYTIISTVTAISGWCHFSRGYRHYCCVNLKINTIIHILTILTVFTISRYIVLNGLDIFNLNILNVYETRLLLRETMGGIIAYVDNWSIKIFNPLCIILSLHTKKYKALMLYILLQIILFGFSSHKIALFIVIILLIFYCCADKFLLKTRYLFYCAVAGTLVTVFSGFNILLSLWRRALLVPAQINYYFFDYFSNHGFDWFAKSFLRHFVVSRYEMPLPRLIGAEFFNNPATNANTGFLGAGYAQGGMVVIIIYAIIIATTINIIDSYTKVISPKIVIGITLLPMLTAFISSDLPTTFLTGGIIITFLLLSILSHCKDRAKLM